MTTIELGHSVRRQTAAMYRRRQIMIELHPLYAVLREKGRRQGVTVDYTAMLDLGYKILWRKSQEEKRQQKLARKKGNK